MTTITNDFSGTSSGQLTTTTYIASSKSETVPAAQSIPITEQLIIPPGTSAAAQSKVINAFFAESEPPEVSFSSERGEVMTVELFACNDVNVYTVGDDNPSGYEPWGSMDHTVHEYLSLRSSAERIQTRNKWTDTYAAPPGINTDFAPLTVYKKSVHRVKVNAGEPKFFKLPRMKPHCYQVMLPTGSGSSSIKLMKVYGSIISDHYNEIDTPTPDALGKITWKKFFSTVGKVIKVIFEVSKVVIPFILTVVKDDKLEIEPENIRLNAILSAKRKHVAHGLKSRKPKQVKRIKSKSKKA